MSIYEDKYWRRIVGGSGCRTILTNHEDNTLARTIRSILVSRVHNHVTWILYTQALLLFLPCLWLRIATCYLLLYRSSSSSLSSFSTLYNWHTIVRMRIRIDDMPLCTRYESTYEIRIDAPCPERSPRNFSMPHIYSKRIFQAKKIFHCVCTNVRSCDSIDQFLSIRYYPIMLIREIVKNRVKKRIKKKKWKKFNPTLHDYTLTLRNQSLDTSDTTFVVLWDTYVTSKSDRVMNNEKVKILSIFWCRLSVERWQHRSERALLTSAQNGSSQLAGTSWFMHINATPRIPKILDGGGGKETRTNRPIPRIAHARNCIHTAAAIQQEERRTFDHFATATVDRVSSLITITRAFL